jgi:hypothetical protein
MADERWIRLYDLLGQSVVPPDSAEVIERAVDKAVKRGDVSYRARWQLIEFWAADYLAGVETDRQEEIKSAVRKANR